VSEEAALSRVLGKEVQHRSSKSGLIIPGIESMKMSLAHCCLPVYGEPIKGFITKTEGVKVHRADCPNIADVKTRLIDVQWDEGDTERYYDADITVTARDRSFLLTDVVTVVNQCKASLDSINAAVNHDTLTSTLKMVIRVHNIEHLENVIANLRKVESVIVVDRTAH
jgi:GTP pyrophosphokinase